jgi:hypothetical protein
LGKNKKKQEIFKTVSRISGVQECDPELYAIASFQGRRNPVTGMIPVPAYSGEAISWATNCITFLSD